MNEQAIKVSTIPGGYSFLRTDGQTFRLLWKPNGHAVLYPGNEFDNLPVIGLVEFDVSVADKVGAACRYVLAYPEQPE